METLKDWKTVLASGVKIETLLGLDKEGPLHQLQSTVLEERRDQVEGNHSVQGESSETGVDTQPLNLTVNTATGQQLEFQWSSPSLSTICPNSRALGSSNQSSIPSHMVISPPSIAVRQLVGPCFIDITQVHDDKQDKPLTDTTQPPD